MARVLTNNFGLQYAIEQSLGVLPGSPAWRILEPNDVSNFGAEITTVERRPISRQRGRKKGTVVDLNSAVEFEADLTLDASTDFAEGFVFAEFANAEFDLKESGAPPSVDGSNDEFDIDAASTLLAGKVVWVTGQGRSLLWGKGYSNAANNGLHELAADLAGSATAIAVETDLVAEASPPANANLQVAGIRVSDGDLTLTVSGSTATLVSSADIADWSTLGILPGTYIHIGSPDANGAVQNALGTAAGSADDTYGYARVVSISSATLNLDKLATTILGTADNSSDGDADILFGRFLRNVAVDADSDDNRYLERSFQFEGAYPDLGGVGTDEYEYAIGNFANELAISVGLTDKSTATWGFIGTNSDDITPTRKTNADSAVNPLRTTALNTSSDVASITTDLVSSASDVCFKSLTITLRNNVEPEKCIGILGAGFVNTGLFEVNIDGQMLFTQKGIVNAIKNNTTVTFAAILDNEDGAIALDIPSLTFGGGDREFPVDASVLVNLTGLAFNDPSGTIPDVSLGLTFFPVVPWA